MKDEGRTNAAMYGQALVLRLSSFVATKSRLHIQRDPHTQPRQVCHQVKDMSLDSAKAMEWKHDPGQHCHA
jgi:hypothetical protein